MNYYLWSTARDYLLSLVAFMVLDCTALMFVHHGGVVVGENTNKYASGDVENLGACNAEIMNLSVLIKHVGTDLDMSVQKLQICVGENGNYKCMESATKLLQE